MIHRPTPNVHLFLPLSSPAPSHTPIRALLSAAGRLRKLGKGQTLFFGGLPEVTACILGTPQNTTGAPNTASATGDTLPSSATSAGSTARESSEGTPAGEPEAQRQVTTLQLLTWVMGNTVTATAEGLLPWASQGVRFHKFHQSKGEIGKGWGGGAEKETVGLEDLYAAANESVTVQEACAGIVKQGEGWAVGDRAARALVLQAVERRATEFGGDFFTQVNRLEDECERELEQEQEQEEEREPDAPIVEAATGKQWDVESVFAAMGPTEVGTEVRAIQPPT